ncbi:Alpha/Beta hydrolase protein [Mycena rebaudengoi]|nr:Alpha/Beta hydrolase protein [Mycena rebaudengoi]
MFQSFVLLKLTTAFFLVAQYQLGIAHAAPLTGPTFKWGDVKPNTNLDWTPCYDGFQCSRLQVPLDYSAPTGGSAYIAVVRLPSKSPRTEYRGPLLFNPGGPGGSGVDAVVGSGAAFATIFGEQYDIVGFDPRGVSHSTPVISFFKTAVERELLIPSAPNIPYPSFNASSDALVQQWAHMQLLGKLAEARNTDNYLQHMTTDNVARDMLRITEAFGFEKLQYWGISYGSVLGATFASLFPDKVGRLIIDGVLDMEAYYTGNLTNQMTDTDKALQIFFDGCAAAGPAGCAFHAPSPAAVASKFDDLLATIRGRPYAVVTPQSHGIVDYSTVRNTVLNALSFPYPFDASGLVMAGFALADLAAGNASTMYAMNEVPTFDCSAAAADRPSQSALEAYLGTACGDVIPFEDSISQLQEFYTKASKVSSFADLLSNTRTTCSGWKVHRAGVFHGLRTCRRCENQFPSTTCRLVGNTADPVTPLAGAIKTSKSFPGSVVLTQDSVGHTSLSAQSLCTYGYFRQYFQNGTLPEPGTVCPVETVLFPSVSGSTAVRRSAYDDEMHQALRAIGGVVRASRSLGW